ncbi:MAG: tail fiber domain-containing protein [Bacteroidota bacterium]
MKKKILQLSMLILIALTAFSVKTIAQQPASPSWKLTGNSGTDTALNFLGTKDANDLIFKTKNLERMRIAKLGKIGMGTTKPAAQLNVVSSDYVTLTNPGILMLGDVKSSNIALDYNVIQARYNGTASSLFLNYYGGDTYLGTYGSVAVSTTGVLTTKLVGINGLSNAGYALNVNSSSTIGGINITDPIDNTALSFTKSGLNNGAQFIKTSTTSGVETIYSYNAGSGAGIFASSANYYGVYGYNGGGNSSGVYGYSIGGSGSVGVTGSCGGIGYGMAAYGNSGSGIYATSTSNYAGYFVGDVYCSGTYVGSDLRLKQNIKDVTSAMDIINQLHPKQYDFKTDGNYKLMKLPAGNHYGLIAQDVEKILPNIVRNSQFETGSVVPPTVRKPGDGETTASLKKVQSETIDFKAVNYTELIPIMIKGMQEQQAVIEKQQQQIDELKQTVQSMTSNQFAAGKSNIDNANTAFLKQNSPNPFNQNTTVQCFVPTTAKQAQLSVYNMNGNLVKTFSLTTGMNQVNISAGTLSSGQYTYSLMIDGKRADSKNMILTK